MKPTLLTAVALACMATPAASASVSKTYNYFSVGGKTLDDIVDELSRQGPRVTGSDARHPGATQMQFTTKLITAQGKNSCQVLDARTTVTAKVMLPKWRKPRKPDPDVKLIWDTLASDIKRHEESHLVVAKNYARELEQKLQAIGRQKDCQTVSEKAKATTARVLARHDKAQADFDRIEGKNFESRITKLLKYRIQQIKLGRLPG